MALNHTFVSAKADGPDASLVKPSNWNSDHVLNTLTNQVVVNEAGSPGGSAGLTYNKITGALKVQTIVAQSANAIEVLDSGAVTLTSVDATGNVLAPTYKVTANAEPAAGTIAAGQAVIWFDKTNGAAQLNVIAKQADGTVVRGAVSLV